MAASGLALRLCAFCRHAAFEMRVCDRCRVTYYCGQKCMDVDWRRHRADCRENLKVRMEDLVKLL